MTNSIMSADWSCSNLFRLNSVLVWVNWNCTWTGLRLCIKWLGLCADFTDFTWTQVRLHVTFWQCDQPIVLPLVLHEVCAESAWSLSSLCRVCMEYQGECKDLAGRCGRRPANLLSTPIITTIIISLIFYAENTAIQPLKMVQHLIWLLWNIMIRVNHITSEPSTHKLVNNLMHGWGGLKLYCEEWLLVTLIGFCIVCCFTTHRWWYKGKKGVKRVNKRVKMMTVIAVVIMIYNRTCTMSDTHVRNQNFKWI